MSNPNQKELKDSISDENIKGLELERDAHQFLWDLGYLIFPRLTLYAIRYKISTYEDQSRESIEKLEVTDLDCYGILFGKNLEKSIFLIDCKHRSENIFAQIFKLKGISTILDINHLLILRESVPETVQQFADTFNIHLQAISSFKKKIKQKQIGSFNLDAYKIIFQLYQQKDSLSKDIISRFSNCFLEINPYQRIKQLRVLYNEIKKYLKDSENSKDIDLKNYIMFRIFLYSLVTITEIASNTIHLSEPHFNGHIEQKLIGNVEFKKKIFEKIKQIEGISDSNSDGFNPLKELAPSFTKPLKELVRQFHTNSFIVQTFLRYNDFIIHEYYLHNKTLNKDEIKKYIGSEDFQLFSDWNLKCLEILDEEKTFPIFLVKLLS